MTTTRTREAGWRWQRLLFHLLLVAVLAAATAHAKISDKRLCFDENCSVVISEGKTTLPYYSKDYDVLSFPGNVDVKIYSKDAGKRLDLWGVEIRGKRGYAPIKFIREFKIHKSKSDLKYTVPTEQFYREQVKNAELNIKESNETSNDNTPSTVQEDHNKVKIPEDEIKKLQESIVPHQVSPSYDSIYDGTILPLENDDIEPPSPSYSTQTLQNSAKVDEDVKLDVYPNSNILSNAYNAITGILGSSGGENSEEEDVDVASSQESESEETTEKTPELQKTDESSLSSEENAGFESDKVTPETNVAEEAVEETVASEVNKTADINEIDLVEPVLSTDNEIVNSDKIDSSPSSEPNINVVTQSIDSVESPQIEKQEVLDKKEEQVAEILIQNATQEFNVADKYAKNEEILESSNTIDAAEAKVDINESSSFVDTTSSESSNQGVVEEINSKSEDLQNNTVPKQEVAVTNTDNLISTKNISETTSTEEKVLDKSEFNLKVTSNNFADVKDSITPEVPLKQEVKEESATKPNESFVSQEQSVQLNLPENKSTPINDDRFNDNLTAPNNVFIEESKLVDSSLNSEKQHEINDNIAESNSNVVIDGSYSTNLPTYLQNDSTIESTESNFQSAESSHEHIVDIPSTPSFGEFLGNRNLLNAGKGFQYDDSEEIAVDKVVIEESNKVVIQTTTSSVNEELLAGTEIKQGEENVSSEEIPPASNVEKIVIPPETCDKSYDCSNEHVRHQYFPDENAVTNARVMADNSETLLYVCITAVTTLLFSLGYYFIENKRFDAFLIAKINNLEKDLMITRKECIQLDESCKSTKTKLDSIEDESFGSNEMVLSLKTELTISENARAELEDQIASLEKELESTSEAGLELERMLREILSSQNEENNPLAQSIEDLQVRLNDQQLANESLKNALYIKTQENETLTADLTVSLKKVEQLQVEVKKLSDELKAETSTKIHLEQTLSDQVQRLEIQLKTLTEDKSHIRKQLKLKELEVKELLDVVEQLNSNTIDFEKIYEVSQIKAEATHLIEERDELKIKLHEEEGAHQLLEEHVKLVKEEVAFLSEQCRAAEKEKKDAETRLEVLTKFFEEKETQRQKEEALWLEKSGEVTSTVERIQTMQNEILNYKQQIEMLKHEILDQEREYKNQIAALEMKIHEHWVAARQNERRLEEVKAESSQLRNRLTLVEKNINDADPEVKLHPRPLYAGLQAAAGANGESGGAIPPPPLPLFGGAESSSSPLMFAGGPGGGPPYMYPPPPLPPYLPPPPPGESRPAPLGGGRLASPPPAGGNNISNSNNPAGSPPMSPPPPLMPYPPHHHHHHPLHHRHRSPPPLPPFADVPPPPLHHHHHHHMPPPPLPTSLQHDSRGQQPSQQQWEDETLPPLRNSTSGYQQRDQRNARGNHKGSLHSSGESLDKSHHGGKV